MQLETFIFQDWRKITLATKLKIFLFHTSTKGHILSFGSDISISVAQSQRKFENQGVTLVKKISALINVWENDITY